MADEYAGHFNGRRPSPLTTPDMSEADKCRARAIECDERAASVSDLKIRQLYESLAKQWWQLAREIDDLEREKVRNADPEQHG